MKRQKEDYLEKIEKIVSLGDKKVLEVGCGNGSRSVQIAARCGSLIAIEPDKETIHKAQEINSAINIEYQQGVAEKLTFDTGYFDIVIFTLSLHHVPIQSMSTAITEAVRVTKKGGCVVFLEPFFEGSYFEAEILFDAGCGDERAEKAAAYCEMLKHTGYTEIIEFKDETIFEIESVEDFISTFSPKKNLDQLAQFLENSKYKLRAERRINIFRV